MKKQDKKGGVLFVLLYVLFFLAFYMYLIKPMAAGNQKLKQSVDADDAVIRSMYATMQNYELRQKELKENLRKALLKTEPFHIREVQEEYINSIKEFFSESGLTVVKVESAENMPFEAKKDEGYSCDDPYSVYRVEPDNSPSSKKQKDKDKDKTPEFIPVVETMEIKVEATGAYSTVEKFLEKINGMEKYLYCDDLSVEITTQSLAENRKDPEVRMTARFLFIRLSEMRCLDPDAMINAKKAAPYVLPDSFMSGAYRNMFSFRNLWPESK